MKCKHEHLFLFFFKQNLHTEKLRLIELVDVLTFFAQKNAFYYNLWLEMRKYLNLCPS